jgi:cellulose synthase/poly-beta-1,6-N-acetylglucosamine synthase-like glycosyltransferase
MSILRLTGLILGIVSLILTFYIFRGPRWRRSNFVLFGIFGICLIVVSLEPNLINNLTGMLSLDLGSHGRLISLLIFSNILLWFLYFFLKIKFDKYKYQFDKVVRNISFESLSDADFAKLKDKKIIVTIPAYNEEENLSHLRDKFNSIIHNEEIGVVVIDDGSSDETYDTAVRLGFCVVRSKINRGGGAALRLGYDIARKTKASIIVTMDADGQHDPSEIEKLVSPIKEGGIDFVIGSRVLGEREKDSSIRIIGVHFFNFVINTLLKTKISDCSSGFRAFRKELLESVTLSEDQYHTSELIIDAVKNGAKIKEVPITIYKRNLGKSKKGKNLIYGFNFAKTIIKTWWR